MNRTRIVTAAALLSASIGQALAAGPADAPPGALSCSGCHPTARFVDTSVTRLVDRNPGDIVAAMQGFESGQTSRDRDGAHRQRLYGRRDQGDRHLVRPAKRLREAIMNKQTSRRDFLKQAAAGASAALLPLPAIAQGAGGRVVVVGGGFAGATCARFIRRIDPRITVTLVEATPTFTACPFSNSVIAGLRDLSAQQFGYDKLAADGIALALAPATAIDAQARVVTLANGSRLPYDRLVLAPGIDIRWDALPGYTEAAAERCRMPGRPASRRCCCAASSRPWRMAAPW